MRNYKQLCKSYLDTVIYMAEHGEMMKAYEYLLYPPAALDGKEEVDTYRAKVRIQLDILKELQNTGMLSGQHNLGFSLPDPEKLVGFKKLRARLIELPDIRKLVDVGCYTGWIGRELSLLGIKVHGIDIHPVIKQRAEYYSAGTLATFEVLPIQQLGMIHPAEYEGAIIFDVLEHCFDPKVVIANVNRSVKKGGRVFINLPHPDGEADSEYYPLEQHEHLYNFSEKAIKKLIPNAEIEIIDNEGGTINWFIEYEV